MSDNGIASCLAASDGKLIWKERVGGNYSASPLLAAGKIYLCSQEGKITVIAESPNYELLAENELPGQIMASPVALQNGLIFRTDSTLYMIGSPTAAAATLSGSKAVPKRN